MKLTILGTATPYPGPGNACSGYLLQARAGAGAGSAVTSIWVDAGTGTLAELQRHVALTEVDAIWISHRHADHTADLLVAYYALRYSPEAEAAFASGLPRRRVRVIGPEALADRLADFLGPSAVEGLQEVFDFTEMSGWGDTVVGDLALSWGPVSHGVPAFALTAVPVAPTDAAVEAAGPGGAGEGVAGETGAERRRVGFTYSGDTRACMSLVEMAEESATLLCEVGYETAPEGGDHVHQTPEDAGLTAAEAGVETLILTHLPRDLDGAEAVRRASGSFGGRVHLATPGRTFDV